MPTHRILVALVIAMGTACSGGSTSALAAPPPTPTSPTDAECKVDTDCACGSDIATHKCAFGPAHKIDTSRQCPDFCTGIAGRMKIACVEGSCKQVKR
jgi:hypothetical protein